MCGICGIVKFDKGISGLDRETIKSMNSKLIHRGPDAQDTFVYKNVALGFTRLSIIGLQNGMQPLTNEDESLILICNGEIFNYIELKQELIQKGHKFKTKTDVEVILHLYEEYGTSFLNYLNGQFAFALYDKRKQKLFCVRDQMGIIPFFYTKIGDTFIFASEIKAILEHPEVKAKVDLIGLDQIFTFAGLLSPRTMFEGIHSLENGHFLEVNDHGDIVDHEYWDLIFPEGEMPMNGIAESVYADEIEAKFEDAIRLRLRADVPYGYYLSGGLDSSMIGMKINKLSRDTRNTAFSIDFKQSSYSESKYQKLVAQASNSDLYQTTFLIEDISKRLIDSVYHSECPIKETYNTASMALSEDVRRKGIKVVLSGEGADEFFAGYVGYRFDKMRAMNLIENKGNQEELNLRNEIWGDKNFFYEKNYSEFETEKKRIFSSSINASYDEINCLNFPVVDKTKLNNRSLLNKRSYLDYKIRLVDHLISDHGDRMAMANSVEVRYPFLDKNLVEYAASIPSDMKLNDFSEKYILKKIGKKFLPKEIINREKFGFIAPGSPFLIQSNIEYINDILSYDLIKKQGYFDPDQIEALKKKYGQKGYTINEPFENDLLITVITFGILQQTFFN